MVRLLLILILVLVLIPRLILRGGSKKNLSYYQDCDFTVYRYLPLHDMLNSETPVGSYKFL